VPGTQLKTASGHTNGSAQQHPSYPLVFRRLDLVPQEPRGFSETEGSSLRTQGAIAATIGFASLGSW